MKIAAAVIVALFVGLLALRLWGLVDWAWWWIALPLWLPASVLGLFFLGNEAVFLFRRFWPPWERHP